MSGKALGGHDGGHSIEMEVEEEEEEGKNKATGRP